MRITDDISSLKGIGPKKAEKLRSRGLATVEDLLWNFPVKYENRQVVTPISQLKIGDTALVEAKVLSKRDGGAGRFRSNAPLSLLVGDGSTSALEVVFFNGTYLSRLFSKGDKFSFFGTVTENRGRLQMVHPDFHKLGAADDLRGIIPVYKNIDGISQHEMRRLMDQVKGLLPEVREWLPEDMVAKYKLASPDFALSNLHNPGNGSAYKQGRFRMVFEELLVLETGMLYAKADNSSAKGARIKAKPADEFINSLAFELTEGQKAAWEDIAKDLEQDKAMNRLVQGDVGSGKTAIAEISMFCACKSGYQSVMMAPTEILAKQHFHSLSSDFSEFGMRVGLLCGSMKESDKKITLQKLSEGEIDILVGTHALIQPDVKFKKLGLVITDEQHRFGVRQRKLLSGKSSRREPNVMVMTATPIPRTLAVILYGDLDVSMIRTMPKGRKPIITRIANEKSRSSMYDFVKERLAEGRQAYVVAPLIEESEKIDARSAEEIYQELSERFSEFNVALIHGALKQDEKDSIMNDFARGDVDLLVSTVVIEVGINVPNATVMVIENSERFGLSQMHQLRGRVGRGDQQSYCYLVLQKESEIAVQRAEIMRDSSDGFVIAEKDLELRGPGELFGTRQHGLPELHISDIVRHADVLEKAKSAALDILTKDPELELDEHAELVRRTEKLFNGKIRLEL